MDKFDLIGMVTLIVFALIVIIIFNIIYHNKNKMNSFDWIVKMEEERKKTKKFETIVIITGFIIMTLIPFGTIKFIQRKSSNPVKKIEVHSEKEYGEKYEFDDTLDYRMLYHINYKHDNNNFLISPYSMTIALEMLRDGAKGETSEEIDNLLQGVEQIKQINIQNRIATANGLFIKEKYKNEIQDSYYSLIKNTYGGDILYDKFESPKIINDWVTKNTKEMIKDPIDSIDPDFILGIFNALAIDVEWFHQFKCDSTTEETFISGDNEYKVEMMHQEYDYNAKYFETDNSKGVILPYKTYDEEGNEAEEGTSLEFIGILPNIDLADYIDFHFSDDYVNLDKLAKDVSEETKLELSLPRFEYRYTFEDFANALKAEGINSAFTDEADFSGISKENDMKVGSAIHETYIKLGETGTKAAAITGFSLVGNALEPDDYERIEIEFNKPFLYLIRDSKTKEILFIGGVYKPNIWNGPTCEE